MTLLTEHRDDRGVVTLTMDRPEVRNAFDPDLMAAIRERVGALAVDAGVRAVVLTGAGPAFSAGADLNWMSSMRDYTHDENVEDARSLDQLMRDLDAFPAPLIARVHGPALGGAMGLIACADIVVASRAAVFGFSETKLGIAPAVISTYVQPKIGVSAARRYFLTGERFDADRAYDLGLVHEVCEADELDVALERVLGEVLSAGPTAQRAVKELIRRIDVAPSLDDATRYTTELIARLRTADEGQEGMQAFFDRRRPAWAPPR